MEVFDLKKEVLSLKVDERMLGFAGFNIRAQGEGAGKEGFLKISAFHQERGSSYVTLTFIIDTERDRTVKSHFADLFETLDEESFRPYLGANMEMIVKIPIEYDEIQDWYIHEVNLYFRSLKGQERLLVEKGIIPALKKSLPCSFEPVDWWPEERPVEKSTLAPKLEDLSTHRAMKNFFRRRFSPDKN